MLWAGEEEAKRYPPKVPFITKQKDYCLWYALLVCLQGTARQLEERYVDKRGVPCCYDNCHSSSCFSFCRENMSSLIKTYRRVPERDFSDSELKSHPNFEGGINISEVALHIPTNILEDGRCEVWCVMGRG